MASRSRGPVPWALLLFASGFSGLIYEVVWLRMLNRTFGVTIYAVSTVLSVYMAGLALGSIGAGKRFAEKKDQLSLYGYAEIAIAAASAVSTAVMLQLPRFVSAFGDLFLGELRFVMYFVLSVAVLLPPTLAMGATLPLLAGALSRARGDIGASTGLLYGANTLGAVFGVLSTGFLLLATLGEIKTVVLASILNLGVGLSALALAKRRPLPEGPVPDIGPGEAAGGAAPAQGTDPLRRILLVAMAVSGAAALAVEVVWSRLLTLILGNSIYAFSLMLAAYLLGVALGSMVMARLLARIQRPWLVFAGLEIAVALLALGSLHTYMALGLSQREPMYTYAQIWSASDFPRLALHALLVVLPLTLGLGALFPLATKLAAGARAPSVVIGEVYAYNTLGAICGSFATGFILIPWLGTLKTFLVYAVLWFGVGLYVAIAARDRIASLPKRALAYGGALVFAAALSFSFRDPFLTVVESRFEPGERLLAYDEDKAATLLAREATYPDGSKIDDLLINGLLVSSTGSWNGITMIDMPLTFHPDPKSSLIVGLGVGEALKASADVGLDTTVVELVPKVKDLFELFHPGESGRYLGSPKVHVRFNDGRNFLLASKDRYDLVFVDGTPPVYASGSVNLYSVEFFHIVRGHLTDDGIFALWFPTPLFEADFWGLVRALGDAFPTIAVYASPGSSGVIALASRSTKAPFSIDAQLARSRLSERGVVARFPSLSGEWVVNGLVLDDGTARRRSAAHPPISDDDPATEFPLFRFLRREPYLQDNSFLFALAGS